MAFPLDSSWRLGDLSAALVGEVDGNCGVCWAYIEM